jgi:hypothetical protein
MNAADGVSWREAQASTRPGRLTVGEAALRFATRAGEEAFERELAFDELAAVELRPPAERPSILLRCRDGREVELESAADSRILGDLLDHVFAPAAGAAADSRRILVALRLQPGGRERARELLAAGQPFEPGATRLTLHDVFLLDDEALLLLSTRDGGLAPLLEPAFWSAPGWRELMAGGVRLAEPAYSSGHEAPHLAHLGLGL